MLCFRVLWCVSAASVSPDDIVRSSVLTCLTRFVCPEARSLGLAQKLLWHSWVVAASSALLCQVSSGLPSGVVASDSGSRRTCGFAARRRVACQARGWCAGMLGRCGGNTRPETARQRYEEHTATCVSRRCADARGCSFEVGYLCLPGLLSGMLSGTVRACA
jgi:hypothetical protein